jgi:iron complex transport system ATP-binding protein
LKPGAILGVIGPNGSGKSTLLKIAAHTLMPRAGSIKILSRDLSSYSRRELAAILGYLPQNVTATFDFTVEQVVALGRYCHLSGIGFLRQADLDIIEHCLAQTETTPFRRRNMSRLSGGERQRVLLASILAQQPKILLLDEPTTGLDLHHQVAFFALLKKLAQNNIAVLVVTHEINLASQFCNRLILMSNGRVAQAGTVRNVINQDVLAEIYHEHVYISEHPLTGKPIALPFNRDDSNHNRESRP